jgi:hypothetical protein
MKTLLSLKKLALAAALPLSLMAATSAQAAFTGPGTVTLKGGKSTLNFHPQFLNQFPALGASLGKYGPASLKGNLNNQNIRIIFPLASASINPTRTTTPASFYDFEHRGGMTMNRDDGSLSVVFNNPSLRASSDCLTPLTQCLELGATLIVNGEVYSDIANFAQTSNLNAPFQISGDNKVDIDNVVLYLTQTGANAMNAFFRLSPGGPIYFDKFFPLGTLNVQGTGAQVICPLYATFQRKYQECR